MLLRCCWCFRCGSCCCKVPTVHHWELLQQQRQQQQQQPAAGRDKRQRLNAYMMYLPETVGMVPDAPSSSVSVAPLSKHASGGKERCRPAEHNPTKGLFTRQSQRPQHRTHNGQCESRYCQP
jgi:hypothetical protein